MSKHPGPFADHHAALARQAGFALFVGFSLACLFGAIIGILIGLALGLATAPFVQ